MNCFVLRLFASVATYCCLLSINQDALAQKLDMKKLEGMKPRSIGPAGMSGRVTAIDAVRSRREIIFVGTASGGLWKSTSGGIQWEPVFDTMAVASIGAVAINQKNPEMIWVGTGEGNPRNSQTSGNGVYRSLDGGLTWRHLGLEKTRNIHRLILHPDDPSTAYVAAIGSAWADTEDRGVYKTTDGGSTWKKVLSVNARTGTADLIMDPSNPNKLVAAMWEYRRWPWFMKSGGAGSGLYVTIDGGITWKKRTEEDGLPKGELGRIGLAISRSSPNVLYALIESKKNALYRSDDGGRKWKKMSDSNIGNRPFYYAEIHVDPANENRVYNLYSVVSVSNDGGKTFEVLVPWNAIHPDHHAWYIHPDDPSFLIDGNDGGLAISHDRGKSWRFVENLPLAQFYHISIDAAVPYNVYGGMQDNGSWKGPSAVWRTGGIRNSYWEEVAFGDGFDVVPDRSNPRYGYAMSQGGSLYRYDTETGDTKVIPPLHPADVPLRFNWNAGIAHDPFDSATIYYGSQFLHRSTDRGDTWQIISPDLTTNDTSKQKQLQSGGLTFDVTAAENHTTIITIAPSPVQRGVVWVGTDDGNVQVTSDAGKTWRNVVKTIKGVPESTWVPQIQASTYDAAEAFVVFDNHRRNDWTPYVYHTNDFGKSWRRLVDDKSVWGYALCVAQDPVESRLLFVGTEFGLYVSIDAGTTWTQWKNGYPTVSTMDLVVHPRDHDLVIGTFGRAAFILDDIRPLRELARSGAGILDRQLHLFEVPDAYLASYKQAAGTRFAGASEFSGQNRPFGALISFVATVDTSRDKQPKESKEQKSDDPTKEGKGSAADSAIVEITNSAKAVVRTLRLKVKSGLNRLSWDLSRKGLRFPAQVKPEPGTGEPGGPMVPPGAYTVRITFGKAVDSANVNVHMDPRQSVSATSIHQKEALLDTLYRRVASATAASDRLRDAKKSLEQIGSLMKDRSDSIATLAKDKGKTLADSIKSLLELIQDKEVQGFRDDPSILNARLNLAWWYVNSSWDPPTETERLAVVQAVNSLRDVAARINGFFDRNWPGFKKTVEDAKIVLVEEYSPLTIE